MAEQSRYLQESDGGGGGAYADDDELSFLPSGNIFSIPAGGLLGSTTNIGADASTPSSLLSGVPAGGFLSGSDVTFNAPGGGLVDLGNLFGGDTGSLIPSSLTLGNLGGNAGLGDVITMTPMVVVGDPTGGNFNLQTETSIFQNPTGVTFETGETQQVVTMTPFVVTDTRITTPEIQLTTAPIVTTQEVVQTGEVVTMGTFVVTDTRITTPQVVITTQPVVTGTKPVTTDEIVTMGTFVVTDTRITTPSVTVVMTTTPLVITTPTFTYATQFTQPPTTTVTVAPTLPPTQPPPPMPTTSGTSTATTGTTGTQRDLKEELRKTLEALKLYQPEIQSMYGDLYNQFMPQGIKQSEAGIIDQYQRDLARLQQRQAGMLSPEDVRQSQQAAREAYGARGQTMGRGAIGAEILNREAVRQAREDQARAAMQQSYGNILNMSNLQTGNIFSPIANLMSGTFNPLGAYPADVYGTNVNAQLARDIAQKNYEAAIRSAELQGSAAKSASTTSLFGDLLKTGATVKVALACMPRDQVIDTPNGSKAIEDIRGGDEVIGYDGLPHRVLQVCSYIENPETEFLTFTLENGRTITTCDKHRILDIPAMEWVVGAKMNGLEVKSIEKKVGVTTSYDLVTEVGGYQIADVPVNSMIPEMLALTLQLVALKHA
jgi:hypothetical protein